MKINKSILQDRWVDYSDEDDGVKFNIKPFPMSQGMLFDMDEKKLLEYTWDKFNYCVTDWQGIVDENDKPLECNEENKKFIFDYIPEITRWASLKINEINESALEKKNQLKI